MPGRLVGARELIQHLIVARVVRVRLEQSRIQFDGFAALQVDRGDFLLHALELAGVEVEIPETAQRFRAQLRVGLSQVEEAPIVLHRLGGARVDLRVLAHFDPARGQILDRGRTVGLRGVRAPQRCSRQTGRQHERARRRHPPSHGLGSGKLESGPCCSAAGCPGAGWPGWAASALAARS